MRGRRGDDYTRSLYGRFPPRVPAPPRPWWCRLLCRMGLHDWRNMNGYCCTCGYRDAVWFGDID